MIEEAANRQRERDADGPTREGSLVPSSLLQEIFVAGQWIPMRRLDLTWLTVLIDPFTRLG